MLIDMNLSDGNKRIIVFAGCERFGKWCGSLTQYEVVYILRVVACVVCSSMSADVAIRCLKI